MFTPDLRVTVRLPAELAAKALTSWQREESDVPLQPAETDAQCAIRTRAGAFGLIGLSIESESFASDGDVVLDLDAWHIGSALDAADDRGLLEGIFPPPRQPKGR